MASQVLQILIEAKLKSDKALKDTRTGLNKIGEAAERNRGKLLGIAGAVGAIGIASIKFASDLDEARNKSAVTFGEFGFLVEEFAETSAEQFALSKRAAFEFAGSLGTILNASGLAAEASAEMSIELVQLASDLASFNNIPIEEALAKLRSGLVGEAEPLRTLGVLISQAALELKAMELGLGDVDGALTEGEKVVARYALIIEQTARQQGDFARTSDDVANATKIARAQLEDAAATLGVQLLPAARAIIGAFSDVVAMFANLSDQTKTVILVIGGVVGGIALLGLALPPLIAAFGLLSGAVGLAAGSFGLLATAAGVVNAAFLLLLANPIVVAMAAIVIGLIALTLWFNNLKTAAEIAEEGIVNITGTMNEMVDSGDLAEIGIRRLSNELDSLIPINEAVVESNNKVSDSLRGEADAAIKAAADIIEASRKKVTEHIEASQAMTALDQQLRESAKAVSDARLADEEAALQKRIDVIIDHQDTMASIDAIFQANADRLAEERLAKDLRLFQFRVDAAKALAENNAAAFAAIRAEVERLPANISPEGAAGRVSGAAVVLQAFKDSQQSVLEDITSAGSVVIDLERQLSGLTDPFADVNLRNLLLQQLSKAEEEVRGLEDITEGVAFRGGRLGELFAPPGGFGGGPPPLLPGTIGMGGVFDPSEIGNNLITINLNVEGSIVAEDLAGVISQGMQELAERGGSAPSEGL